MLVNYTVQNLTSIFEKVLVPHDRSPYTVKKKVREFPVPSRDVTPKLSLGENNDVKTELFLPRGVWLVTSRLETGNS